MIAQIYEIQTPREAQLMIDLGVDHIGSVVLPTDAMQSDLLRSTVQLTQRAGRISSLIPLFNDIDMITRAVDYYRPDMLHLCEALPIDELEGEGLNAIVERQKFIRRHFSHLQIMRTIPVAAKPYSEIVPTLSLAAVFEPYSDWFLTDTYLTSAPNLCDGQPGDGQPVAGYVGITGQTSDWDVCRQLVLSFRVPVILAGGIGPDNAIAGINAVSPAGIDSCTRTNREDEHGRPIRFEKDPDKVKLFVNIAHSIKNQTRITN